MQFDHIKASLIGILGSLGEVGDGAIHVGLIHGLRDTHASEWLIGGAQGDPAAFTRIKNLCSVGRRIR